MRRRRLTSNRRRRGCASRCGTACRKGLLEPAASLAEIAAGEPEAPERGGEAERRLSRAGFEGVAESCAQVVVLALQPPQPGCLLRSGQLRLSLVSIPVQVVPATRSGAKISFHQVHKPSGSRIRYQKVVPGVGPVETDEIVKGYEVGDGKYVLLDEKDFDEVKLEAKKTIDLVQFVGLHEIDAVYYDRPFFVLPDDEGDTEAYIVLRDALKKTKKVALGQVVIRGKGAVVAIKACGDGLMLETLGPDGWSTQRLSNQHEAGLWQSSLQYLIRETAQPGPGNRAVLARLSEFLFMEVLR